MELGRSFTFRNITMLLEPKVGNIYFLKTVAPVKRAHRHACPFKVFLLLLVLKTFQKPTFYMCPRFDHHKLTSFVGRCFYVYLFAVTLLSNHLKCLDVRTALSDTISTAAPELRALCAKPLQKPHTVHSALHTTENVPLLPASRDFCISLVYFSTTAHTVQA